MPKFEDHVCLLYKQDEDILKQFIESGWFINLRRHLQRMTLISRDHPLTRGYFKSYAACRNEEIRHIVHYGYMVHPFSMFNLYWELYMFLLFITQFILIPVDSLYPISMVHKEITIAGCITDVLQTGDIIKIFFTGYYDSNRSRVILEPSKVAKRYLKTYFFIDILSCSYSYIRPINRFIAVNTYVLIFARLMNRLKIFRMIRCIETLELFRVISEFFNTFTARNAPEAVTGVCLHRRDRPRGVGEYRRYNAKAIFWGYWALNDSMFWCLLEHMGYSSYLFKGIKVIMIFIAVLFWSFSFAFFIENYLAGKNHGWVKAWDKPKELEEICHTYFLATMMILLVSYGETAMEHVIRYISSIFFLCFGFAMQLFLYSQILQVWTKYASAENKHHSLHKQFKEYMKYKELPVSLRERIFSYFEFKFHKQFFKESDINNMLSPLLKQEILLHVTRNHIDKVDLFKHLPENILIKVVAHLKSEIYLPGDVIISAGTSGNCMFFIYHGTVAVYTPSGKELCHLEDGSHFGEIALIFNETRVATVIAVSSCELFMLRRSDFLETIDPFPEFKEQLLALATERMKSTIRESE